MGLKLGAGDSGKEGRMSRSAWYLLWFDGGGEHVWRERGGGEAWGAWYGMIWHVGTYRKNIYLYFMRAGKLRIVSPPPGQTGARSFDTAAIYVFKDFMRDLGM